MDQPREAIRLPGTGITLAADAAGPSDGPPILFLHGGGQTRHSWKRGIEEAAGRGYRAISLDLRGHGESDWSPDGIYDIDLFVADLRAVITTLGSPPILVGASLGGLVALLIAAAPPPPVAGLVLVDVAVRLESEGTEEIGGFMNSAPDGFASLDEAADAVAAYLPHRPRPQDTSGLLRNLRLREDGRYRWHWDPAFVQPGSRQAMPDPGLFERAAAALTVPTLLVRGGISKVVSREGVAHFRGIVPHAETAEVAGADHMVAGDANDQFNAAVFDFLDRHAPARA